MAQRTLSSCSAASASRTRGCMEVPDGYPPIYGEIAGPPGSPVVVLYAHYDVQPAPPEQGWTTDPWTPTRKDDGRIYGRGAADDKGGLVDPPRHAAGLRRQAAVHRQADPRGDGGDGEQPRGRSSRRTPSCSPATCSSSATWATCGSASRR